MTRDLYGINTSMKIYVYVNILKARCCIENFLTIRWLEMRNIVFVGKMIMLLLDIDFQYKHKEVLRLSENLLCLTILNIQLSFFYSLDSSYTTCFEHILFSMFKIIAIFIFWHSHSSISVASLSKYQSTTGDKVSSFYR